MEIQELKTSVEKSLYQRREAIVDGHTTIAHGPTERT